MKKFRTIADAKALARQRLIALHYAEIALNQEQLEADAIAKQQAKQNFEY